MSCFTCGKDWTGHSRCHCATCHENFSSVRAFDRHRKDFKCLLPASRGLVNRDGYWGLPGEWPSSLHGKPVNATKPAA